MVPIPSLLCKETDQLSDRKCRVFWGIVWRNQQLRFSQTRLQCPEANVLHSNGLFFSFGIFMAKSVGLSLKISCTVYVACRYCANWIYTQIYSQIYTQIYTQIYIYSGQEKRRNHTTSYGDTLLMVTWRTMGFPKVCHETDSLLVMMWMSAFLVQLE